MSETKGCGCGGMSFGDNRFRGLWRESHSVPMHSFHQGGRGLTQPSTRCCGTELVRHTGLVGCAVCHRRTVLASGRG